MKKKIKRKVGRPSKYDPALCQSLVDFFNIDPIVYRDMTVTYKNGDTVDKSVPEAAPTPFFSTWQRKVDIDDNTMMRWVEKYPEFRAAYKKAKRLQEEFFMETALKGVHNSVFTIFTMKNVCGWRDEKHLEHSGEIKVTEQELNARVSRIRSLLEPLSVSQN